MVAGILTGMSGMFLPGGLGDGDGGDYTRTPPPLQKIVDWFHGRASTNRREDIHHTLGYGPGQAAPGEDMRAMILGQDVPGFSADSGVIGLVTRVAALEKTVPKSMKPSSAAVGAGSYALQDDGAVTFSGASTVRLDGVFDGLGQDDYEVLLYAQLSTPAALRVAFSTGGAPELTSYFYLRNIATGGGTAPITATNLNEAGFLLGYATTFAIYAAQLRVTSPKKPFVTIASWRTSQHTAPSGTAANHQVVVGSGWHPGANLFDGIRLSCDTAGVTFTGWIKVIKKA